MAIDRSLKFADIIHAVANPVKKIISYVPPNPLFILSNLSSQHLFLSFSTSLALTLPLPLLSIQG
jgi:hypothetical protein